MNEKNDKVLLQHLCDERFQVKTRNGARWHFDVAMGYELFEYLLGKSGEWVPYDELWRAFHSTVNGAADDGLAGTVAQLEADGHALSAEKVRGVFEATWDLIDRLNTGKQISGNELADVVKPLREVSRAHRDREHAAREEP